jgi:hypothetical protein|tara:strand:+ start:9371 stop:10375 length:1005 start_codon:yes stop_codon:yes gene_type:complete
MNIVFDALQVYLPAKRKQTPSGWLAFNAPCCEHNGTTPDTRQRGGLIANADEGVSFHCFNCGFKTSWRNGRNLSFKMKKFMRWLNVPDDTITKLALQVLQTKTDSTGHKTFITLPKFVSKELPPKSKPIHEWADYKALEPGGIDKDLFKVLEYIAARKLNLNDYDFYWTPEAGYRDRLIIPFYYREKVVGYTARKVVESKVKYLSEQQPGYVFNIDEQTDDRKYVVAVEGPIDAIAIDGVALLGSEIKEQQTALLNSLGKHVIVVPDRDEAGQKLVYDAMEAGWSVSMPDWSQDIGDANDAVRKYGRLHTLYSIVKNAEESQLKIKLRMKKWFT